MIDRGHKSVAPQEVLMSDLVFTLIIIGGFALCTLVLRLVTQRVGAVATSVHEK